jgi:hypothetical protein
MTPEIKTEPEVEYLLNEGQTLWICAAAVGDENSGQGAKDILHDMVKIVMAWRRGKVLPRWEVPALMGLYKDFETPDAGPLPDWMKK